MENKVLTNQDFINFYNSASLKESRYGTIEAIAYIIRNANDEDLKLAMTEVINEYLEFYEVDGRKVISSKEMPDILAEKLIDKKQRMFREKLAAEEKRYFKDKEVKMIIAKDIIERLK